MAGARWAVHPSLTGTIPWQVSSRANSPMLTALGLARPCCCLQGQLYFARPALPSAAAAEEQGQLSCSCYLRASSPTQHRWRGVEGGCPFPTCASIRPMRTKTRSSIHSQLTHAPVNEVSSTVLPKQGTGSASPSATAGKGGRGLLSRQRCVAGAREEDIYPLPSLPHHR